jgi:hypothetical protein
MSEGAVDMVKIRINAHKSSHKSSSPRGRHTLSRRRTAAHCLKTHAGTYDHEKKDIEKAVVTLEKGKKEDLQAKYKKYYELIHT